MKLYTQPLNKLSNILPATITVAVYGLGKMGLPIAVVFAHKGFNVIGVDVNKTVVDSINKGISTVKEEADLDTFVRKVVRQKKLITTTDLIEASKKSDIKIIIVPTYLDEKNNPDLSIVKSVSEKIGKGLNKGDIVILESTAPPGTTTDVIGKTLEKTSGLKLNKDFSVAHCPERTNSGTAIADIMGRLNPKIVGGSDEKTTLIVKKIYEHINDKGVIPVKNTTVAEMVKVTEGIYRDVNIALANNVYLLCRELGIDARDVISAANTDAVCHLLSPGPGVGGHCIPVYPYFILKKVKHNKELLTMARKINDNMSHHVITLAKEALQEKNINFKKAKILVLGIAYRGGVKETRKSPGLKIAQELSKISDNIFAHDPLFNADEIKKYGLQYKKDFTDIDCIILTANHAEYKKLDWKKIQKELKTKIIIDTINILNVEHIRNLDFAVKRIGYSE